MDELKLMVLLIIEQIPSPETTTRKIYNMQSPNSKSLFSLTFNYKVNNYFMNVRFSVFPAT